MHEYFFFSKTITEEQVRQIIKEAGFDPNDYQYAPLVQNDGYDVTGQVPMALSRLANAAKRLNIKVTIESGPSATVAEEESIELFAMAGTPYQVTINMSLQSVQTLIQLGYQLYGFKAVQTSSGGGAPTVWFNTTNFSTLTQVGWTEQYQAYTSNTVNFGPNTRIQATFSANIGLGQILQVGAGGGGPVVGGGVKGAVSIFNTVQQRFTCGINQMQNVNGASVATPLCAFPLLGNGLDVIAPIQKVLLTFSTQPVNTGTVIFQAYSPGILIDLTSSQQRTVNYDAEAGVWSWGGFNWAQSIPASANLIPLLIESPATQFLQDMSDFSVRQRLSLRQSER